MNNLKYKGILYFISGVILATLCIQIYWNYKNYNVAKQQLMNDVQTSLDNAVDTYYTSLAKDNSLFMFRDSSRFSGHERFEFRGIRPDTLMVTSNLSTPHRLGEWRNRFKDSTEISISFIDSIGPNIKTAAALGILDSIVNPIETLSSKIIISFTEDTLSLGRIDSLLTSELKRKNIAIDFGMVHTGFLQRKDTLRPDFVNEAYLSTETSSPYLIYDNALKIYYKNITLTILKRNLVGILLSFILVLGVVLCLLYLLRIIRQQKQLAEVKNDLISNITHEFKTPIATIGVAMEGIESFKDDKDPEKPLRYARISREQVDKLNAMVEKLLETATLDSEKLVLDLERFDVVSLVEQLCDSEALKQSGKQVQFSTEVPSATLLVDTFHLENAINNILDNAIKYGGDEIKVSLKTQGDSCIISIFDNGTDLTAQQAKQIFEKFYRVPKGNTHDVKGFGIGLYYSKKIVERHGGSIAVQVKNGTQFDISLPLR